MYVNKIIDVINSDESDETPIANERIETKTSKKDPEPIQINEPFGKKFLEIMNFYFQLF